MRNIVLLITALLFSASFSPHTRGQEQKRPEADSAASSDSVSGRYEGTARSRLQGNIHVVVQIRLNGEKITGMMNTPLGDFPVTDGSYTGGRVNIKFSAGDEAGTITGEYKDGSITGNFS